MGRLAVLALLCFVMAAAASEAQPNLLSLAKVWLCAGIYRLRRLC
jgi:hypothetical protein